jgi:hypothetical protein
MGKGGRLKHLSSELYYLVIGGLPAQWAASLLQAVGIALCVGVADALAGAPVPFWVNFLGFACLLGGLLVGAGVKSDPPYLGPLALIVIPALLITLAPLFLVVAAAWCVEKVNRRCRGRLGDGRAPGSPCGE